MLLAPGGVEPTCLRCFDHENPEHQENRKRWGCDGPSKDPVLELEPCPFCRGELETCPECGGANRIPIFDCPNKLVELWHQEYVTAALMVDKGILPDSGGWYEQSAKFVEAYPLLSSEIEHWRSVHIERARKKAARKGKEV
jgi:hypothetical protein